MSPLEKIHVVIADDHPLVCEGIKAIVSSMKSVNEIHAFTEPKEALEHIIMHSPDVAILDIDMGQMTGLEIAKKIKLLDLPTKVILITLYKEKDFVLRALDYGVKGYLNKDAVQDEIIRCMLNVLEDKRYIGQSVFENGTDISEYLDEIQKIKDNYNQLTQTEKNIVKLVADGLTSLEISKHLFISKKTVENHRSNICRKLKLSGFNALVIWTNTNKKIIDLID